jgi:hypothetical protein
VEDRLMRLQPAIDLEEFEDTMAEFGDYERREARRARRRQKKSDRRDRRAERRDSRRERRQERRLDKVQRKKEKVREKLAQVPGGAAPPAGPFRRRGAEPSLQPAPTTWPPDAQQAQQPEDEEGGWVEDVLDTAQDFLEDQLDPEDEGGDEATEGIGAWQPFQRRAATARPPAGDGAWGPAVRLGRKLRIQAALGHRAAVIDLKPGLYLVAELPEAVTRTEFGVAPVLAPLMITAARRALDEPPRERRGPLAALFRRRRQEPIRYVQIQPAAQPPAAPAPLALPGPVAEEPAIVAAPNVGWADDATVAAAYGCDRCEKERR